MNGLLSLETDILVKFYVVGFVLACAFSIHIYLIISSVIPHYFAFVFSFYSINIYSLPLLYQELN